MTKRPKSPFPTTNQKWARERNFAKFIIRGIQAKARVLLKGHILTPVETDEIMDIMSMTRRVLLKWEDKAEVSKEIYKKESKS